MTPGEARAISNDNTASIDNDRGWVFRKIAARAERGYFSLVLMDASDMPGWVHSHEENSYRIEELVKSLARDGYEIVDFQDMDGSGFKISW